MVYLSISALNFALAVIYGSQWLTAGNVFMGVLCFGLFIKELKNEH